VLIRRRRPRKPFFIGLLVAALALLGGVWLGGHPSHLPAFVRDNVVGDSDTRVVREAIDQVHDTYYREISKDELADDAISGVVRRLGDRFSHYFDPKQYRRFLAAQSSEFTGIGVEVNKDPRGLYVAGVFDGSPAQRAGIKPGDVIVKAAGVALRGKGQREAVALIQGPRGTDIRLEFVHRRHRHAATLTRSTVSVPVVASRLLRGRKLGVVRLAQFGPGAHAEVYEALRALLRRRARGIVFDLRENPGGLVSEAQLVASAFLRDGVIVTTKGRAVASKTLTATGRPVAPDIPLVVLVDRNTASAAEIVTGALQDHGRAVVVGTRTFGKGIFQELLELSNGGALDITAGQYFTPNGTNLGGRGVNTGAGIRPQVRASDNPHTAHDEALSKALEVLARRSP
jgi:carboxyl-terminal processing protease